MDALQGYPLNPNGNFNWVFAVEIIVIGVLAIFFLFYFNRLFATIVSYGIRAYTWHKYRAYVDITSLQISLLGGRIFFKRIHYQAHNITCSVYEGHITWRYWLRQVQEAEVFQDEDEAHESRKEAATPDGASSTQDGSTSSADKSQPEHRDIYDEEKAGLKLQKKLPCRISVQVAGVEAFIYNRSPLYDGIVEAASRKANSPPSSSDEQASTQASSHSNGDNDSNEKGQLFGSKAEKTDTRSMRAGHDAQSEPQLPSFLRIFPIAIQCKRAAAALGNENTANVLVAKVERSSGIIDAGRAGRLDLYKLLFDFDFENVNVTMKPNHDFKELQLDAAQRILERQQREPPMPDTPIAQALRTAKHSWQQLWPLRPRVVHDDASLKTSSTQSFVGPPGNTTRDNAPGATPWHGLTRYLAEKEVTEAEEWQNVEYAKAITLAECPKITMRFYWDIPGLVTDATTDSAFILKPAAAEDMNGAPPPEYGMNLGFHGGSVTYGPWADRQRINLQQLFFPPTYSDAVPSKPLKSGDFRVSTVFNICVTVEEDVVLRIPTRETSKDTRWKGRADGAIPSRSHDTQAGKAKPTKSKKAKHQKPTKGQKAPVTADARPYGWLDITVKKDATIRYTQDMYPRSNGYRNFLDVDVKGLEMSSSVNHGLLWKSGGLTLEADLSYPLSWNSLRKWPFNIVCNDLELFILRDHLFLIIDLVNDWASGPPPDFYTFVPFNYQLDMTFRNFCMYLNVNDANIINDPANLERNDYLTIEGQLHALLGIPQEKYIPKRNQISFDVLASSLSMRMLSHSRSTLSTFLKDKRVVEVPHLTLNGSYNSNTDLLPGLTDVLRMDIAARGFSIQAYGFLLRQLVGVKENYFGDYLHFKTLDEFQNANEDLEEANRLTASFPKPKSITELDVILRIIVDESTIMFPTNLYAANNFIQAEVPRADLDLRVSSYYLDMGLNLSPISFLSGAPAPQDDASTAGSTSSTQLYIAGLDLNGHRMFGLPPDEPAYVSEWDIGVGKITGELSDSFIHDLALAGTSLAVMMGDGDNALPLVSPSIVLDATFVQVRTQIVHLWMHVGADALLLSTDPITVESNDWASEMFSQRVNVVAPKFTFACVDGRDVVRHRHGRSDMTVAHTYAFLQTGVTVDVVMRKRNFMQELQKQQAHIQLSSQRTGRAAFLRRSHIHAPISPEADDDFEPPAMCSPPLPLPIRDMGFHDDGASSLRSKSSVRSRTRLSRKSSSSSLAASLKSTGVPTSITHAKQISTLPQRATAISTSHHSENGKLQGYELNGLVPNTRDRRLPERDTQNPKSATMAFSSPYMEPYFPLATVEPDQTYVPDYPLLPTSSSEESPNASVGDTIEASEADQKREHVSVFINFMPGIRAYAEPHVGITVANFMRDLEPRNPEEVLDAFQVNVLGSIRDKQAGQHGDESIVEIQANLPAAHIRMALFDDEQQRTDQVDLTISSLETTVRIRNRPSKLGGSQTLALHNSLGAVQLAVLPLYSSSTQNPAIQLNIDNVLLWLAIADANSFHLSFRETSLVAEGAQTQSLCSFVLRLLPIIKEIQAEFEGIQRDDSHRLQLLTYVLTSYGERAGDPPFMSRMVSTLLAFPDHFRNQDSWKILMRFRYILFNLPESVMHDLKTKSKAPRLNCPQDAPQKTLDSWTQWYNWDIPYVNQTLAFKKIFNISGDEMADSMNLKPTALTFRSEIIRVAVQSEMDAAEILLEETSLGVENTPPKTPEGLMLVEENTRTSTVVQMHSDAVSLSFDWSLVDIVGSVLEMKDELMSLTSTMESSDSRTAVQALEDGLARHDFNLVLSTDTGKISLQSVNLRHVGRSDGLKLSVIGTTRATEELGQCVSAILTCDTAVTELHGPSRQIWQTLLTSPKLYVDQLHPAAGIKQAPTITVAVAYEDLQLAVVEQIPGLLHLVDSIIVDEVARIQHLVSQIAPESSSTLASSPQIKSALEPTDMPPNVAPKLHVALLAGQIHFSLSLLQTLNYQLEGTAVSLRLAPSLTQSGTFTVDFDVGRQNHAFVNTSRNERHSQGILQLPPINGNVGLIFTDTRTSVSIASTVEKIEVDAAAIQGVVGVINRPEVQDIISAIKAGIDDVKARVEDVIPTKESPKPELEKQTKALLFKVRFALLGVRVAASNVHRTGRSSVEVEFGIGPLYVTASNKASIVDGGPPLPKIRAKVQDIGAKLFLRDENGLHACGHTTTSLMLHFDCAADDKATVTRHLKIRSGELEVHAFPETAATLVDVINHLQDRLKHLDLTKEIEYLRHIRDQRRAKVIRKIANDNGLASTDERPFSPEDLLAIRTTIELSNIRACWLVDDSFAAKADARVEDLVFSIARVEFITRGGHEARLTIMDLQLQLADRADGRHVRSLNSALLPEVSFSVGIWSQGKNRSLAVRATGKPLDLRLESSFMLPLNAAQRSIEHAIKSFHNGTATWQNTPTSTGAPRAQVVDMKHLSSLLVEADFAGAVVYMQGAGPRHTDTSPESASSPRHGAQHGRYGQFADDGSRMQTTLTSPGIALKVEYNSQDQQPSVNAELMIDASTNKLLPNVVPLVLEVSNSVKEVMQNQTEEEKELQEESVRKDSSTVQKFFEEDSLITANPSAIFGKTKVNLGIRVCRQEFGLTCQPIARVDASASLDDFYFTMNTIDSEEYGHFFSVSAVMTKLTAEVKHMYSREPTVSYDMDSIVLSAMNTKHLSGTAGISAVLKINPTRLSINGRQFQDLMLFQEIWLPPEIRNAASAVSVADDAPNAKSEEYLVQRYQTAAAAAAFPWNATISISKLIVDVDLGQSIGKSSFTIENLWASQFKKSSWEQNLCIGMDSMGTDSTGRMSGFIRLEKLGIRMAIKWPDDKSKMMSHKTPLIQASIGFQRLRAKVAYDYQPFAFGDIEGFDFLMYNVRQSGTSRDRLVALLDFAKAYVFCTSTSPAQAVGLYQAFHRLIQDKQVAYAQSLKEIESHLRRESTVVPTRFGPAIPNSPVKQKTDNRTSISLHTDVVVSLGALCFGVYPSTFLDSQMLKVEANTIQARFAVSLDRGLVTSMLSLTLGQLQVALAAARRVTVKPKLGEVSVDDVITNALNSKGGTILRVPKVVASMQTWQTPDTNKVEYIFKSLFDGKIDVGWNLSRIDFIKGMWTTHARALASRLGKSLPESAVKITAGPQKGGDNGDNSANTHVQGKITAEISLPQSRYEYTALEPPVIETPQLRDMGEATPPLEWIGLHRERLPNVTHQIIIVSLLEVCKEVEDAYERILGSS